MWLVLDHTHLFLDEGDVGEDEEDVSPKQKQLSEDEYLGDQSLPSPRGEGVEEVSSVQDPRETQTLLLPRCGTDTCVTTLSPAQWIHISILTELLQLLWTKNYGIEECGNKRRVKFEMQKICFQKSTLK